MTTKMSDNIFFYRSIPCEFIAESADFQVNAHLKRPPEVHLTFT